MKRNIGFLTALLSILMLGVIWGNSLQPATASDAVSLGLLARIQESFFSVFGTDLPLSNHILRKMGHLSEFFLLGFFLTQAVSLLKQSRGSALPLSLYLGLLTAVLDETIQSVVPGRGPMVTDVLIDHTGFVLGLLLANWICVRFFKTGRRYRH